MNSPSSAFVDDQRSAGAALSPQKIKLGEELPIFCEKCGYALHGLPQTRCDRCDILQFHCPECGHHQPINTLRPAVQKALGRMRAVWLVWSVFFRINFFGWLLVAWAAMGVEFSYRLSWSRTTGMTNYNIRHYDLDLGIMIGFGVFGLAFGMIGRMLLLRWRRGWVVGVVLAVLICIAISIGAMLRRSDFTRYDNVPSPFTGDFITMMLVGASSAILGASIVWAVWLALVHIFLPERTAQALLDWQESQSQRVTDLARH